MEHIGTNKVKLTGLVHNASPCRSFSSINCRAHINLLTPEFYI